MNRAVWFNVLPEGAKSIGTLHHFVTQSTALPSLLTHLVFLRVSQINGCAHCIDVHTRDLLAEGMSVEKVVLVPVWNEAALAVFGEKDLVELTLTIAAMNAINRMGVSFRMKPRAKA